jgi:tetratricopeptide (TPR) repeat protein
MGVDEDFRGVRSMIAAGRNSEAAGAISEIALSRRGDPLALLTCVSLLRTICADEEADSAARLLTSADWGASAPEVARGLRAMGYPAEALGVARSADMGDGGRLEAAALRDMGRHAEAAEILSGMPDRATEDEIDLAESLSLSGASDEAIGIAESLLEGSPGDFRVQRMYCSALVSVGRKRDADRYVRLRLKEDSDSADSNALAAHLFWIMGRVTVAGAYAGKAVKADPGHLGGMEVLAYSMIKRGMTREAKIIAGAINEKSPGNPSAFRILNACR